MLLVFATFGIFLRGSAFITSFYTFLLLGGLLLFMLVPTLLFIKVVELFRPFVGFLFSSFLALVTRCTFLFGFRFAILVSWVVLI